MSEPKHEAVRWLWYALEDVCAAEALAASYPHGSRHVCWLAQQAAEKVLKTILVYEGIRFPRTHDLALLRSMVPEGWPIREAQEGLTELTAYAVEARYPGEWEETTLEDAATALETARDMVVAVRASLRARGVATIDELPLLPGEAR